MHAVQLLLQLLLSALRPLHSLLGYFSTEALVVFCSDHSSILLVRNSHWGAHS